MAELVRLPKLGANVGEGMVGTWHVAVGDKVSVGDALVEVITSKAVFDVESPAPGNVLSICAPEKSHLPVGYILCVIGQNGETTPDVKAENEATLAAFKQAETAGGKSPAEGRKIRATPGARRLAKAENVDLGDVPPAAGNSVVCEEDVRTFLKYRQMRPD